MPDPFRPPGVMRTDKGNPSGPKIIFTLDLVMGLTSPGVERREFPLGELAVSSWDTPADVDRRLSEFMDQVRAELLRQAR